MKNLSAEETAESRRLRCLEIASNLNVPFADVNSFVMNAACIERYVVSNKLPLHKGQRIEVSKAIELAFEQCMEEIEQPKQPANDRNPLNPIIQPRMTFFSRLFGNVGREEVIVKGNPAATVRGIW
ncbi:MAG: hypothetical protein M1292_00800 [Bacteroidetes bacterium]|nr:hypothetical protein [Bacteroidota bacterium]